jgi:hypothetical protein
MARPEEAASRRCRSCQRALPEAAEVGWECECGTAVCTDPECFEEWFKLVAGGEGTRCLSCGQIT